MTPADPKTSTRQDDETQGRRRRDPEATQAAILATAEKLFLERGPGDTPTSLIARRAGVTKSLIHHHFGSKEELWAEIKRRHFEQYYEVQKQLLATSEGTVELLHQSIVAYFRFLQQDARSVAFMSWRFVEADDSCLGQEDDLFELGMEKIREAQERGELRPDIEPLSMIKAFLAMTLQWFQTKNMTCQMLDDSVDIEALEERYLEDILTLFFDGVRARPESSQPERASNPEPT